MGLSYRPGGASWSYHGFASLRAQIATFEGIEDIEAWWRNHDRSEMDTPLFPWLDSSDVRGFFTSTDCERMIPRFRAILRHHDDDLSEYDRANLLALVLGMKHCAEHGCAMSWG